MKKLISCLTMLAIVLTCVFSIPSTEVKAATTEKDLIGTWKSADKDLTLGVFSKGVLKIKSEKDKKWVSGTWKLDSSKKTVTVKEEKYLKNSTSFKYTDKKLTSKKDSKFYFSKASSKTPSTSTSSMSKKDLVGTWLSNDKNFDMVLTSDGKVFRRGNGETVYEEVNLMGPWTMNASKKTVVIPDYVYGMGDATYKYTKNKLTSADNKDFYYNKVSSKTDIK